MQVRVRDSAFKPVEDAAVVLSVEAPGGVHSQIAAEPSAAEAGLFEAEIASGKAGAYRVKATVKDADGKLIGEPATGWAANPLADETASLVNNRALLERIATWSGGRVLSLDDLPSLAKLLPKLNVPVTETTFGTSVAFAVAAGRAGGLAGHRMVVEEEGCMRKKVRLRTVVSLEAQLQTGREMPAQGNALGCAVETGLALKGRDKMVFGGDSGLSRPDGADASFVALPRAMPWAGMFEALGLQLRNLGRGQVRWALFAAIAVLAVKRVGVVLLTLMLAMCADAVADEPAPRELSVLVVVGAGGADEYEARFHREAEVWQGTCKKAGVECSVIGSGDGKKGQTDAAALQAWIEKFIAEKKNGLWIVLIGHGSFDGREAKFNLRGPDITASDMAAWLKPVTGDLALINTAPSSAPFLKALAGQHRVIIAATKGPDEVFATRFGGYFIKAFAGEPDADQDGDRQVSLLEAFLWASRQVARFYDNEGRLATEHALIDDNGDGVGTRAEAFEGLRLKTKPDEAGAPDGLLSRQWVLLLNEDESKLSEETRRKRDGLEREAEALRAKKDAMNADEYYREMERVFLEIAKLYK